MIEFMKENDLQAEFTSAISQKIITLALIVFIDDAELFIMDKSNSLNAIMNKAELAINVWREVLEVTGGAMRPPKCAWTLVTYKKFSSQSFFQSVHALETYIFQMRTTRSM